MLKDVLKLSKYERYLRRGVEVVGLENFLAVNADLFGYQKEYSELVNGQIEERIDEDTVKIIDFAEVIESFVLVDNKTKLRPYFAILTTAYNLIDAGEIRLTPEAISAYTNISVTDVREKLYMLVKDGYIRKKAVRQTPEWQELTQKIRKEKGYDTKVKRLEAKKSDEIAKQERKFGKELIRLEDKIAKFEKVQAELHVPVTDEGKKHLIALRENIENSKRINISEVESRYLQKINDASVKISKEEANFWRITEKGKHMPTYYYDISGKGCDLIKLIRQKYPRMFEESRKIFRQVRAHIEPRDIVNSNLSDILHLYHIPKELLNKHVELAFFREKLLDWNQLMEEHVTLCDLMIGEFNTTKDSTRGRCELAYATGLQNKNDAHFLARMYIDNDGIVWVQKKNDKPCRIGTDMKHDIFYAFAKSSETLRTFASGKLTPEYCSILKKAIQEDEIQLAETGDERQNCKEVHILGTQNLKINIYDAIGTREYILHDGTRVEIPKDFGKDKGNVLILLPARIRTSYKTYL